MPTIDLPHGTVHYRARRPREAATPPVVFVHGFLVNATLWTKTADALADAGVRSYAARLAAGLAHDRARRPADQSPRGIARQIIAFMEALDLDDVTLVGNDTGGAICQFLLDTDASRIGRVVLTNCDAFTNFPPAPFGQLFKAFRSPSVIRALLAPMRATAVRHSPAGFGLLVNQPLDAEQTRAWVEPCLSDPAIRQDVARFAQRGGPRGSQCRVKAPRQLRSAGAAGVGSRATASSSSTTPIDCALRSPTPGLSRSRAAEPSSPTTSPRGWPTRSPPSKPSTHDLRLKPSRGEPGNGDCGWDARLLRLSSVSSARREAPSVARARRAGRPRRSPRCARARRSSAPPAAGRRS